MADMSPVGDWSSSSRVLSSKDSEAGERKAGAKVPIAGLDGTELSRGAISTSSVAASPYCVEAAILKA